MIHALTIITPAQLTDALNTVAHGFNLSFDLWDALFDMGLVDSMTDSDGEMRDVLTPAGANVWAEGQVISS